MLQIACLRVRGAVLACEEAEGGAPVRLHRVQSCLEDAKEVASNGYGELFARPLAFVKGGPSRAFVVFEHHPMSARDAIEKAAGGTQAGRVREVRALASELFDGLAYLEDSGIAHRALSLGALRLSSGGRLKIRHFGLFYATNEAKLVGGGLGDPLYIPPDVLALGPCAARAAGLSHGDDVWAAGIILMCLSRGHSRPFPDIQKKSAVCGLISLVQRSNARSSQAQSVQRVQRWLDTSDVRALDADLSDFIGKCLKLRGYNRPSANDMLGHPFLSRGGQGGSARAVRAGATWRRRLRLRCAHLTIDSRMQRLSAFAVMKNKYSGRVGSRKNTENVGKREQKQAMLRGKASGHAEAKDVWSGDDLWNILRTFLAVRGETLEAFLASRGLVDNPPPITQLPLAVTGTTGHCQVVFSTASEGVTRRSGCVSFSLDVANLARTARRDAWSDSWVRDKDTAARAVALAGWATRTLPSILRHLPHSTAQLRECVLALCREGSTVPHHLRADVWRGLLGAHADCEGLFAGRVVESRWVRDQKSQEVLQTLHRQLKLDLPRCHAYSGLVQSTWTLQVIRTLLGAWAVGAPKGVDSKRRYWQGFDSVAGVLALVCRHRGGPSASWALLERVSDRYFRHYLVDSSKSRLAAHSRLAERVLLFHSPRLALHLNGGGIDPAVYAVSWILTLFTHEMDAEAEIGGACDFLDCVLCHGAFFIVSAVAAAVAIHKRELLGRPQATLLSWFSSAPRVCPRGLARAAKIIHDTTPRHAYAPAYDDIESGERAPRATDSLRRSKSVPSVPSVASITTPPARSKSPLLERLGFWAGTPTSSRKKRLPRAAAGKPFPPPLSIHYDDLKKIISRQDGKAPRVAGGENASLDNCFDWIERLKSTLNENGSFELNGKKKNDGVNEGKWGWRLGQPIVVDIRDHPSGMDRLRGKSGQRESQNVIYFPMDQDNKPPRFSDVVSTAVTTTFKTATSLISTPLKIVQNRVSGSKGDPDAKRIGSPQSEHRDSSPNTWDSLARQIEVERGRFNDGFGFDFSKKAPSSGVPRVSRPVVILSDERANAEYAAIELAKIGLAGILVARGVPMPQALPAKSPSAG